MVIENNSEYITVALPSKGECYPCKKPSLRLSHMTAMDENIITSEELRDSMEVCDTLLSHKLIDKEIDVKDLCVGDRNALLVALRIDGYGNDYECHEFDFDGNETVRNIDLSKVECEEFTMTSDENGLFNYCDKHDNKYKFRFITHKDDCELIASCDGVSDIYELYRLCLKKCVFSFNGNKENVFETIDKMSEAVLERFFTFISVNSPDISLDYPIGDTLFNDIK